MRTDNKGEVGTADPSMPPEFGWDWTGEPYIRVTLEAVQAGEGAPDGLLWAKMHDRPYEGAGLGAWVAHQCIEHLWDGADPTVDPLRWLRAKIMAAGARTLYVKTGIVGCELAVEIDRAWNTSWGALELGLPPDTISHSTRQAAYYETRTTHAVVSWMLAALKGSEDAYGRWTATPNTDAAKCLEPQQHAVTHWAAYGAWRAFEVWCERLGGKWRKGDYVDLLRDINSHANTWLRNARAGDTTAMLLHAYGYKGRVIAAPTTQGATTAPATATTPTETGT